MVNGRRIRFFNPSIGIRKGDTLSPYLFIMCLERLSKGIKAEVRAKNWTPISISPRGPKLSHLFFADDLTLLARENNTNFHTIVSILNTFTKLSGQTTNHQKSKAIYSNNCPSAMTDQCTQSINIQPSHNFEKYLGYPIFSKKSKNSDFQFIIDNMNTRLAGWKTKFLNMADRTVLSKSTLRAMPTHIMNYIRILRKVTKNINKIQRDFVWGSYTKKKKIHLLNWDVLTTEKKHGGLGT